MTKTHIILLSGGSGSRLWPLSSGVRSKQFLKVLPDGAGGRCSMVQRTYARVRSHLPGADVTVATCAEQDNAVLVFGAISAMLSGDGAA